jgi:hypothetical protein
MLLLDDPRWEELRDAYGDGSEVAAALVELQEPALDSEFWSDLYSRICHQYTVYTSTYAAVPHLVEYARALPAEKRLDSLLLVGLAHACSFIDDAPDMPSDLRFAYNAAIKSAAPLLRECLGIPLTESQFRYVQSALAALQGFIDLAFVIEALDTCFTCPSCQTMVDVMQSSLNLHHHRPKKRS